MQSDPERTRDVVDPERLYRKSLFAPRRILDLAAIREVFQNDARLDRQPIRWLFLFLHTQNQALVDLSDELGGHGYRHENLIPAPQGRWILQVSRIDSMTPEQLHRRSLFLNNIAERCGIYYMGYMVPGSGAVCLPGALSAPGDEGRETE